MIHSDLEIEKQALRSLKLALKSTDWSNISLEHKLELIDLINTIINRINCYIEPDDKKLAEMRESD